MSRLVILAPMRIEARAARRGARWSAVERIGIGPRRARAASERAGDGPAILVGFAGGLDPALRPGDVVLASELRGSGDPIRCPDTGVLAGVLRRGGLRVHVGPIHSSEHLVVLSARARLASEGALAVDMESAWYAERNRDRAPIVLRVVLDTPRAELHRPLRAIAAAVRAYRSLRAACRLLADWERALGPRELVLAAPRASCAGVTRAVEIVRRTLEREGAPVYVRKQIVHNTHVVAELEREGAIFVEEVDEVPPGARLIFSAHGVSPAVRAAAAERELDVLDATCPLVAKVHAEARRYSAAGLEIVLVGHRGHEEVDGTVGEAPDRIRVIATVEEARTIDVTDANRVAALTQTTLAADETAAVIEVLRERFPKLAVPPAEDICYATQNRQDAVRALAADTELLLVVGSQNSSNSRRLVEVAARAGAQARLIEHAEDIEPAMLAGVRRIGLTAGASAPESLVQGVVSAIAGLGAVTLSERVVAQERVHFKLPAQLRTPLDQEPAA